MSVKLDLKPLKLLQERLTELEAGRVHVGLLAETSGRVPKRKNTIDNNPGLGFVHEFGLSYTILKGRITNSIPERSFIRMPLMLHLGKLLEGKDWIATLMKGGTKRVLGFLGLLGEDTIQEAFATGGYGQWPALAPRTVSRKKSARILIETAQMRKAITSKVVT